MGEYWKPVNVTKREYIHPHDLNDGLKLPEWNHPKSATTRLMAEKWAADDVVVYVSDYEGFIDTSGTFEGDAPAYDSLDKDGYKRITRPY